MEDKISQNYSKVKLSLLVFPLGIIISVVAFLYSQNALNPIAYTEIQKNVFLFLNAKLSQFPYFQHNITQIGNALVFISLLSFIIIYLPKIKEALLSASVLSLIISRIPKELLDVPRPAQIFDNQIFTIIGEKAIGFSSCPSGHSITFFTTLTVLFFAFISPKKSIFYRFLEYIIFIFIGLVLAFSRVAVGAHHPLDVILGSALGFIAGVLGIIFSQKFSVWNWLSDKILFILLLICTGLILKKTWEEPLVIYFWALISLIFSLYAISKNYFQRK